MHPAYFYEQAKWLGWRSVKVLLLNRPRKKYFCYVCMSFSRVMRLLDYDRLCFTIGFTNSRFNAQSNQRQTRGLKPNYVIASGIGAWRGKGEVLRFAK